MDATYQIKDVAERTGFTPATLRYYEEIGLLPPPSRTPAGYRRYDQRTVDRLSFIARAKQLGCTLEEIADLTLAWDGGRCGPVQDRLRAIVVDKLATAQQQIVELNTLTAELRRAATTLEMHRPEGACDDRCGCVADQVDVTITAKPEAAPIACTLAPESIPARVDDWQRALQHVVRRDEIDRGVRLTFDPGVVLGDLVDLVASEHDCCRFFEFAITVDDRGTGLDVRAPAEARPVVHALFGAPS